jgi:hypothetical protein
MTTLVQDYDPLPLELQLCINKVDGILFMHNSRWDLLSFFFNTSFVQLTGKGRVYIFTYIPSPLNSVFFFFFLVVGLGFTASQGWVCM